MKLLVLTDLDGTLLDAETYSFDAAKEALDQLRARGVPLILVSSKTRAEMEPLRFQFDGQDPFIVENGAAIFAPQGYFSCPWEEAMLRGPYQCVELGIPYATLRVALRELEQHLGCRLRGFGDMPAEEIAERTGLSLPDARRAKQREYDEPFVADPPHPPLDAMNAFLAPKALCCTRGGRFYHLMGNTDKGRACQILIDQFRRHYGGPTVTVAVGDSLNDLPMLAIADHPMLVKKADGSHEPGLDLPRLIRLPGIGPVGWNQAILDLLTQV